MYPATTNPLRIARPSRDLPAAERFWVEGVGLEVLWRTPPGLPAEDGHGLVMLGWPSACWHLELVDAPETAAAWTPTEEDLLVLYLGAPSAPDLEDRLVAAGGRRVQARNPYWERWGITIEDPDGYRLVLSHRSWE